MGKLIQFPTPKDPRQELADKLGAEPMDPTTEEYVEILRHGDEVDEIDFLERQLQVPE